jgi:hypothetical protein
VGGEWLRVKKTKRVGKVGGNDDVLREVSLNILRDRIYTPKFIAIIPTTAHILS